MKIFILKTNLFEEKDTLEQAITYFESGHQVVSFDTTLPKLDENDWDTALKELLTADRVITV